MPRPRMRTVFSSKAQVMALMTTDVDRVARFTHQLFVIIDAPNEIAVGKIFLYNLLGVLCFFGLGVAIPCLLLNHFAGKTISGALDNLMKARDERVALIFGKDIPTIDNALLMSMRMFILVLTQVIGSVILITILEHYFIIAAVIILRRNNPVIPDNKYSIDLENRALFLTVTNKRVLDANVCGQHEIVRRGGGII
ncbi:hypothetical protein B0H14DRAFT_3880075 [Mycena olivaceomarginata]|nr:hypothetical protein B0H14DRAFT_3880075 [Mycena olivaceomarginata]